MPSDDYLDAAGFSLWFCGKGIYNFLGIVLTLHSWGFYIRCKFVNGKGGGVCREAPFLCRWGIYEVFSGNRWSWCMCRDGCEMLGHAILRF